MVRTLIGEPFLAKYSANSAALVLESSPPMTIRPLRLSLARASGGSGCREVDATQAHGHQGVAHAPLARLE